MRAGAIGGRLRAALLLALLAGTGRADGPPKADDGTIVVREALAVARVYAGARSLIHTDAVEAQVVAGTWKPPAEGEALAAPDGSARSWKRVRADEGGTFALEGPTYLSTSVTLPEARTLLLHAVGHDVVYVNGEPRPGDPYGYGWWSLPVRLRAGANELLFRVSRGRLTARLLVPRAPWYVQEEDRLVGDVDDVGGGLKQGEWVLATVTVVNTLDEGLGPLGVTSGDSVRPVTGTGRDGMSWQAARVPALSVAKVPLTAFVPADTGTEDRTSAFALHDGKLGEAAGSVTIRMRQGTAVRRKTFLSVIDGSVQYAAVRSASGKGSQDDATIFTLHGASVEAMGQAEAYAPKEWARIVAPTNRRPYGFDWEDWGRQDALEALREFGTPYYRPLFLTGHSMGGHGTWHLGVTYPDRWTALGPSAGWVSFRSYGNAPPPSKDPVVALLERAGAASDTLALLENLRGTPVYALHGDADDNVPVTEMRTITTRLRELGGNVTTHEQPGAGHWWDLSPEPGADCVDWAPLMQAFQAAGAQPARATQEVTFVTAHPGVSATRRWVTVEASERPFEPCRVHARFTPDGNELRVSTTNVARLRLGVVPVPVVVDGVRFEGVPHARSLPFRREAGRWTRGDTLPGEKGPERCGPFKAAFDRGFQLVYGTAGTPEENAWALAKARYDAEAWTYRANGRTDLLSDVEYLAGFTAGRNAILYGHREMNRAWEVLGTPKVSVRRGVVDVGTRRFEGDGLACLFVLPHPRSDVTSIGVICGTGLPGLRLTDRLPYLASGVAVPDLVVLSTAMLTQGEAGVLGAGFFGNDWSVERGTWAFR